MSSIQTLSLALRNREKEGEPLPQLFKQFDQYGMKLRRGWLHLFAAAAGGFKSMWSTFLSLHMQYEDGTRVPTLYMSADNDKLTFGTAAIASYRNIHVNEAEQLIEQEDPEVLDWLGEVTGHLWVNFDSAPTTADIAQELDAFATVYGEWPHLLVIDNLMDVDTYGAGESEAISQNAILGFFRQVARETGAAILVLCHVTGEYVNGDKPIPRSGLMNKIDKLPQVVLTSFRDDTNSLNISIVKQRRGRAQADGSLYVTLPLVPEKAFLGTGG